MVETKAKALHQRKVPKERVYEKQREKRMVETQAKARHQRKVPQGKGVRINREA